MKRIVRSIITVFLAILTMFTLAIFIDEIIYYPAKTEFFMTLPNRKILLIISNLFLILTLIIYGTIFSKKESERIYGNWVTKFTNNPIIVTDSNMKIIFANDTFLIMTGYKKEEIYGKTPSVFKSNKQSKDFYADMWAKLKKEKRWTGDVWDIKKNGVYIKKNLFINAVKGIDSWEKENYVGVYNDLDVSEDLLEFTMFKDSDKSKDRFGAILDSEFLKKEKGTNAVLSISISNIKTLINIYTSEVVNRLINDFVDSLKDNTNGEVIIAEAAKSEFLVILNSYYTLENVRKFMHSIIGDEKNYQKLSESKYLIKLNCGISFYPKDSTNIDTLYKKATIAKLSIVDEPFKAFEIYNEEIEKKVLEDMLMKQNLVKAISSKDFSLVYQPQIIIGTDKVIGAEALIRWENGEYKNISPAKYISIAEDNGLIIPISNWIIENVCKQIKKWERKGLTNFRVGINISPSHFYSSDFLGFVKRTLTKENISPNRIEFELTERILIQDFQMVKSIVRDLRDFGIKVAVDDFGTGYSSLKYLKKIKFDKIKVDKEFIEDYPKKDKGILCESIIKMGINLGLEVVVEGVENKEQLDFVKNAGGEVVQGYYYSKALKEKEFEEYLIIKNG